MFWVPEYVLFSPPEHFYMMKYMLNILPIDIVNVENTLVICIALILIFVIVICLFSFFLFGNPALKFHLVIFYDPSSINIIACC